MGEIVTITKAEKIARQLRNQKKNIVLAGGCFDVLHKGHLTFLENAKKAGDVLFVLLESDSNVRRLKGKGRPLNNQKKRALELAQTPSVSFVILAPKLSSNADYFNLTRKLKPHVIAITEGDPREKEKEAQAKSIGGKVVVVTKNLANYSTTKIVKNL